MSGGAGPGAWIGQIPGQWPQAADCGKGVTDGLASDLWQGAVHGFPALAHWGQLTECFGRLSCGLQHVEQHSCALSTGFQRRHASPFGRQPAMSPDIVECTLGPESSPVENSGADSKGQIQRWRHCLQVLHCFKNYQANVHNIAGASKLRLLQGPLVQACGYPLGALRVGKFTSLNLVNTPISRGLGHRIHAQMLQMKR